MRGLVHDLSQHQTDEQLQAEAGAFLSNHGVVQIVAELLALIQEQEPSWFTRQDRCKRFSTNLRIIWFDQRRDIRARITAAITHLGPKSAYQLARHEQVKLIDLALTCGEADLETYDRAFDPVELATYGDASTICREIVSHFPWDSNEPTERKFMAKALQRLMAGECCLRPDVKREPFVTQMDAKAIFAKLVNTGGQEAKAPPMAFKPLFGKLTKTLGVHTPRLTVPVAAPMPTIAITPTAPLPSSSGSGVTPAPTSDSGLKRLGLSADDQARFYAEFKDHTGIELEDIGGLDRETLSYMCTLLIRCEWLPRESFLRKAMVSFLTALKPNIYKADELNATSLTTLEKLFFGTLRKLEKHELVNKLENARERYFRPGSV